MMSVLMIVQLINSVVCFWAAYVPSLFFICVLANYAVLGGLFAVFPVSVTKVFGLEHGPQIYVQILFGSFISSILNLITTKYVLPATNFVTLFYIGSITQILCLLTIWWFKEELDEERLAKYDAIEPANSSSSNKK